jgi:hypothetical protein
MDFDDILAVCNLQQPRLPQRRGADLQILLPAYSEDGYQFRASLLTPDRWDVETLMDPPVNGWEIETGYYTTIRDLCLAGF